MAAVAAGLAKSGAGAGEKIADQARLAREMGALRRPIGSDGAQEMVLHDPRHAQDAVLHQAGTDVAAAEEDELHEAGELPRGGVGRLEMQLEADHRARRARKAAQGMLAGGERHGAGRPGPIFRPHRDRAVAQLDPRHQGTAHHLRSGA